MRLLLATYDGYSHVWQAYRLVQRLVQRGHDVRWLVQERYRETVEETGATHVPTREIPSHEDAESAPLEVWARRFQGEAPLHALDLQRALDDAPADCVLVDATIIGAPAGVDGHQTTLGQLGLVPLLHCPAEAAFILQGTHPACELPPHPAVEGKVFFTGPLLPPLRPWTVPEWWAELDDRPLVLVSTGTLVKHKGLYWDAMNAMGDLPVQVLCTTDLRGMNGLLEPPENVRSAPWVSFPHVLPRTALMVTNGGYMGMQWAIAAGVPMVVDGTTEDKPEVGRRVEWAGIGRSLCDADAPVSKLRETIVEVMTNPRYRARAREIRAQVALADPATLGAQLLEQLVPACVEQRQAVGG